MIEWLEFSSVFCWKMCWHWIQAKSLRSIIYSASSNNKKNTFPDKFLRSHYLHISSPNLHSLCFPACSVHSIPMLHLLHNSHFLTKQLTFPICHLPLHSHSVRHYVLMKHNFCLCLIGVRPGGYWRMKIFCFWPSLQSHFSHDQ